MVSTKKRLERLEGGWKGRGIAIIIVRPGETNEEAWQKHLAEHPEDEKAELILIIRGSGQDPRGASSPPRPKPNDSAAAPGPAPQIIFR
jgi:hypothetical protein